MNVKSYKKLMLAATVVILLNFNSCAKYEDGPAFSLATKTARLTGEWEVVKIDNEKPIEDGKVILEFEKNGDLAFGYSYPGYSYSYDGEWEWNSGKESLDITIVGVNWEWDILRLTNDELWFEDQDGQEWECEKE